MDTEAGAATDDLVTINGGTQGDIVVLSIIDNARVVVVKDGIGNIACGADITLNDTTDRIILEFNGATWCRWASADN